MICAFLRACRSRGPARPIAVLVCLAALGVADKAVSAQSGARSTRFDVYEASISDLQKALGDRRTTSVQLVDAYLARIAAYDVQGPAINALIRLNPRARADAAALDEERRRGHIRGPLHGIPIILKDNYDTGDIPTTGGSLALATLQPREDAFIVHKLRDAGAVVIGKANMHELAAGITNISSLGGQTRNPYDPERCPGGSSGGTGAAIAASFAAVGWGSDTCGSIRIPSAFNSLVGLRPTQGLVSRTGIIPLSHTQDVGGPLARSVTDLAIALDATVGADSADSDTRALDGRTIPRFVDSLNAGALRGARLGVLTNYFTDTDPAIRDTIRAAIRAMKAAGAEVVDVTMANFDSLIAGTSVIDYEMKYDFMDYLARHPGAPVSSMTEVLQRGLYHESLENRFKRIDSIGTRDGEPYQRALAKRAPLRARTVALLDSLQLDALVYPTMRQRPVRIGEAQPGSTCPLSASSGLPALSVQAGFTADGLPVGIELLGRPFADARLVALAYSFEQLGPRRRPPVSTPALAAGLAPRRTAFTTVATAAPASARASFVFDPMHRTLRYDVRVSGVGADRVEAVVLRRADSTRAGRVIHRLIGPDALQAAGTATLSEVDRRALLDGKLVLSVFTTANRTVSGDARLALPR